jgi:hypothetical protein
MRATPTCAAGIAARTGAHDHRLTALPDVLCSATANERRPIGLAVATDRDASEVNRVHE